MKSIVVFVGLLIAGSIAQLSVSPLTDSVTAVGVLPITTTANNYAIDLYSFFVPANAQAVTVTFANTNTQCTYLHLYIRTSGLPCGYNNYNSSYLCSSAADPGNGLSGTNSYTYQTGYSSELFEFSENTNWYFGINRYSTYNTYACTYTLTVNVTTCPNNTIGNQLSASDSACSNLTPVTLPYSATIAPSTAFVNVYKATVPQNTGHILITIVSNSTGGYIYGKSYSPASNSDYNCYTGSYSTGDTYYTYNLFCYTPRAGDFYITYYDNSGFTFSNITINALVCAPGMGGFNCTYNATDITNSTTSAYTGVITPNSATDLTYPFVYYYFDQPMNYTGSPVTVTLSSSTGSAYLYIRVDGFPEDSSTNGYEDSSEYDSAPASFIVNQYDFGRIMFGVECYSSTPCNYALGIGMSVTPPSATTGSVSGVPMMTTGVTGARMTTGMAVPTPTTGLRMTTGVARATTGRNASSTSTAQVGTSTSSAMVMLPSILLIALIAMMF